MSLNNEHIPSTAAQSGQQDVKTQSGKPSGFSQQSGLGSNLTQSVILDYVTKTLRAASLSCDDKSDSIVKKSDVSKGVPQSVSVSVAAAPRSYKLSNTAGAKIKGGMKPLSITIPYSAIFSNGAGAGILNAVLALDPTASPEFASLAALYDEYRVNSVRMKFQTNATASTGTPDCMLVLGYDPTDSTALATTREGCELTRHKLFAVPNIAGASAVLMNGKPLEFDFAINASESLSLSATGTVTAMPGSWRETNSSLTPQTNGWIKSYFLNAGAANAPVILAILYVTLSFRSRK